MGEERLPAKRNRFGIKKPPLYVTIKTFLDRYPDGQIFKELIQNADDAGAKVVKFYLDPRQHGTKDLIDPAMADFQGPALLVYNDAPFTEEDWDGIQKPQCSNKAEDPMKVGKFGIGFNSVYHVTDLPTIISGKMKMIGYLDPQEKIWEGESGISYPFSEVCRYKDTIAPYQKICNFSNSFHGTLFQFPLRTKESKLSDKSHNISTLQKLLDALKKEADCLLLFLRSVFMIEIIELPAVEKALFGISIVCNDDRQLINSVTTALKDQKVQTSTRECSVTVTTACSTSEYQWCVVDQVGSEDPEVLKAANNLHLLPWVGVAYKGKKDPTGSGGRVFCCLPMPNEVLSPLPVHVNGTFGLTDDRRTLKWKTSERQNDAVSQWNEMIINKLLPSCYAQLIHQCIHRGLSASDVYSAWPDVGLVGKDTNWSPLLKSFFEYLLKMNVLWTDCESASGSCGKWVNLNSAIVTLVSTESTTMSTIKKLMCNCDTNLVEVPKHILIGLEYSKYRLRELSPDLVRQMVKTNSTNMKRDEKLHLLTYCLSDRDYSKIVGLALLPLLNGTFATFTANTFQSKVFLCTKDYPSFLFKPFNVVNDLLVDDGHEVELCDLAKSGSTQLSLLDDIKVAQILHKCLPAPCGPYLSQNSLPLDWLKSFWEWSISHKLDAFVGLFLVPLSHPQGCISRMVSLDKSIVMQIECDDNEKLLACMKKLPLQLTLLEEYPYARQNSLFQFMHRMTAAGLLQALTNIDRTVLKHVQLNTDEAFTIQSFLASVATITTFQEETLSELPILITDRRTVSSAQIARQNSWKGQIIVLPDEFAGKPYPAGLIVLSNTWNQIQFLQQLLPNFVRFPTATELISEILLPMIADKSAFSNECGVIMKHIFDIVTDIKNYSQIISKLSFIQVNSISELRAPCELYYPSKEMQELFYKKPVFPLPPFDQPTYLDKLIICGLKCTLATKDIMEIIEEIKAPNSPSPQLVDKIRITRSCAVLKYIQNNMKDNLQWMLKSFTAYNIIPIEHFPPAGYPQCLVWKGSKFESHLISYSEHVVLEKSDITSLIAGSQVYMVRNECAFSPEKRNQSSAIRAKHVLAHFKEVIEHFKDISDDILHRIIHHTYKFLMDNISECDDLHKFSHPWIWVGKKFVYPQVAALKQNHQFRYNFDPYHYTIPDEFCKYDKLFSRFHVPLETTNHQLVAVLAAIKEECVFNDEEALSMVLGILNHLTKNGERSIDLPNETIYVPIESSPLKLESSKDVVYSDNHCLNQYIATYKSGKDYKIIHPAIASNLARCLHINPLSACIASKSYIFQSISQHEPLVTRLKNILGDYKDGLTIIKELLQNADDAGATEVNICYDARTHCKDPKQLFFPHMASCHGPALVVHNNAQFTEADFENITKLGGATKLHEPLKIGKFGLGFCSVYHITDVPSFISGDLFSIFDPTGQHLSSSEFDPARPRGQRISLKHPIFEVSKQLDPYIGVFDFDPLTTFDGTIFRFPFRIAPSEISDSVYSKESIERLKSDFIKAGSKLLLFLQNVEVITFSEIHSQDGKFSSIVKLQKMEQCTYTPACKYYEISKVTPQQRDVEHWLVSTHNDEVVHCGAQKYATASVACSLKLHKLEKTYSVQCVDGESFCYLPLSCKTGLPVHISSNFAVINNRRGIWTTDQTTPNQGDSESKWNSELMRTVIPQAYICMLKALKTLFENKKLQSYSFYTLWPIHHNLQQQIPWEICVTRVYEGIGSYDLLYSVFTSKWLNVRDSQLLSDSILGLKYESNISAASVVNEACKQLKLPVIKLPEVYISKLNISLFTEEMFATRFFINIDSIDQKCKINVLERMFKMYSLSSIDEERWQCIKNHLTSNPSVPCGPDGNRLRKCNEVVDPQASFAPLFYPEEQLFPMETFCNNKTICSALKELGMVSELLPWTMLEERTRLIDSLHKQNGHADLQRTKIIMECADYNISHQLEPDKELQVRLSYFCIFPTQQKPLEFPVKWCGTGKLQSSRELIISGNSQFYDFGLIAGSQAGILSSDFKHLSEKCSRIFGFRMKPSLYEVLKQLELLVSYVHDTKAFFSNKIISNMCTETYKFFEMYMENNKLQNELLKIPCIWCGASFVHPTCIADQWSLNGPFLFRTPWTIAAAPKLKKFLQIKRQFSAQDIIYALQKVSDLCKNFPVDQIYHEFLHAAVSELTKCEIPPEADVMMPSHRFVMVKAKDLYYCDDEGWPVDPKCEMINGIVPNILARKLGVRPVRNKKLEMNSLPFLALPFGQREPLTQRIKNILREYPFDITFLKELLQNADDSKATKMFVILDNRHHGEHKVLSDEWGALQGPALLVWNDKPFTDKDMKGIQELGCGSKRSETEAIGQYGIGFNVVYHITDCPSFITNKSLCVFDPHCRYIPKAEPSQPGGVYNLTEDFLDYFSDLKSAYLYTGLKDNPNFHSGVLFRFPLRHSPELVRKSEIATSSNLLDTQMQEPVTISKMKKKIDEWAPQIKQSLYFLQNITEIKFLTIDSRQPELFTTLYHYKCNLNDSAMEMRHKICSASSAFTNINRQPCSFLYPLEIIEFDSSGRELLREQWAIQQGIGDVLNVSQNWAFSGKMKPRHGIAAPLNTPTRCDGQVFCFLPLPISSGLPVHINGQFILDASRRALWASTNPGQQDERTLWNEKILSSISSSYAEFLGKITSCFEKSSHDIDVVKSMLQKYYCLFPNWTDKSGTSIRDYWLLMAENIYKKLAGQNASIFCRLEATGTEINTYWHPVYSDKRCDQIYFVDKSIKAELAKILECLGMKITVAPLFIRNLFMNLGTEIPIIGPYTVFTYYRECCINLGQIPCHIKDTAFKSVSDFKTFSQYLLCSKNECQFPQSPFGSPLLLTADNLLRKFDKCSKVLLSKYSDLFHHKLHLFLHPEMIMLPYSSDYFLTPNECTFDFINDLIASILNQRLHKVHQLPLSESCVTIGSLSSLWKCISHDPVFKSQLYPIVQNWAILLTTDEELFSYSDDRVVPVIVDTLKMAHGTIKYSEAVGALKMLGIPILDSTVIEAHVSCCPHTSDHSRVLKNLFQLHRNGDISSKLDEKTVNILIDYFQSITFSLGQNDIHFFLNLPLCMDITGSFKAPSKCDACYIWPEQLPEAGISKWLNGSNTLFLSKKWKWTIFFSLHLHAKEICVEDVYMKYIFKHFSTLSSTERHTHLEYIRDRVFQGSKSEFQNLLKKLPFIEHDGTLMCVCHFYHPKKAIFGFFPTTFFSLPTSFGTNQWLQFLISLGLKIAPTKEEFLTFCNQTATGLVVNTLQASNQLLECLFEEETWHEDSEFLFKISTIPFVCSDPAAKYTWIAAAYKTPCIQRDGMYICMTQLNGSATTKYQGLLWTVKPTVNIETKDDTSLLNSLHVITSPKIADVVENIKHISASKFADNKLFTNYPSSYQTAKQCKALIEVVAQHFKYLKDHNGFQCCSCLSELCCIPVHAIPGQPNFDGFVLVKPNRVMLDESASQFHPYLHALPNDLSEFASNLYTVGVAKLLGLNHIRLALELIYENELLTECSAVPVDPNIITMVQKLVDKLYNLLTQSDKTKTSAEVLKPLYLPSSSGRLLESSQLFYCDCDTYKNLHSSTVGKEITFVRLPEGCQFTDIQFIMLLPNAIRPKPISKYCTEKLHPQSIIADECKVATKIQNVLTSASFRAAVCALVRHETNQETSCQVEALLKLFQDKVKVYEANPLKVKLLSCSSGNEIASINVSIFIETSDVSCVFYIRGMPPTYELHKIYMEIGKRLALVINDKVDVKMNSEYLIERLGILMMAEDAEEMRDYLMRLNIKLDRSVVEQDDNITPSLGARIPRAWLQYLDHSVGNIYRPEEWVAYEMEEDAPIFVRILCPVLDDTHEANQLPKRYVIWISSDDTKEVSYVDLYKFCSPAVYSTQQPDVCCTDIVPAATEEDDQRPRKKLRLDNVQSAKDELSKQLKECWKLSKEEQEKVLRRLKFKWHPDRNSDQADLAEEIFKYLMEQVEHHRRHNETVDDRGATTSSNYQYSSGNFESSDFHSKWRSSSNHSPHNGPSCRFEGMTPRANSTEAKRWLRQAEGDFEALKILFEQVMIRSDICCNVCFMAHEVVEKALKAGRYATSGMSSDNLKNHQMMPHAYAIVSEKPEVAHGLDKLVAPLEPYYLDTRFPNRHSGDTAPKDVFHAQHATDAKEAAAKVLHIIQRVVNSRNN